MLNNLATTLNDQGKYEQAEPLLRQAPALRRRLFDDEQPRGSVTGDHCARLAERLHLAVASSLRVWPLQLSARRESMQKPKSCCGTP